MDYLRIYENRFKEVETIFDALPISIFAVNQIFRIVRLNYTALDYLKENHFKNVIDELCYKKIHQRNEICPYCPLTNEWNEIKFEGKKFITLEKIINIKSNQTLKIVFILLSGGNIRMIEIIEDITKQIEKQEEIIRIENLASIGTMISGIAHELNNPLTGISLNLQILLAKFQNIDESLDKNREDITKRFKLIQKDLQKASNIVSDILSLVRPGLKEKYKLELQKIVLRAKENAIRLYPMLSKKIKWEIEETKPIYILGSANKLERLFFNLFKNSLQAYDYKEGVIGVFYKVKDKKVMVLIYDEAGGIPKNILKKIFVPFSSVNFNSRGTGLGLSISYNIIREHEGKVKVKTYKNKTIFFIRFPIVD